ncbi:MAG: rRNA maturation RNase YbeY [Chlorobi bacterium]|nr:rRNA maturation RNase YbeY [Chlorobiota bacterium]
MVGLVLNNFDLPDRIEEKSIKRWITDCVLAEKKILGNLNYEFLSDDELLKINIEYLDHNTFTDIITFNNSENSDIISGEIYISYDRIIDNYQKHDTTLVSETLRVIIHGVLHLCSYDDKSDSDKELMREKENFYIAKFFA